MNFIRIGELNILGRGLSLDKLSVPGQGKSSRLNKPVLKALGAKTNPIQVRPVLKVKTICCLDCVLI